MDPIRAGETKQRTGCGPDRGFRARNPRGCSLSDIETNPALRGANGCSAWNRARARADGNSPDEMSGRHGEIVRRMQAHLLVTNPNWSSYLIDQESVPISWATPKRRQIA